MLCRGGYAMSDWGQLGLCLISFLYMRSLIRLCFTFIAFSRFHLHFVSLSTIFLDLYAVLVFYFSHFMKAHLKLVKNFKILVDTVFLINYKTVSNSF